MNRDFWKERPVFVTGHTGFKGAWLSAWLNELRARVFGYSLPPPTDPSLFRLLSLDQVSTVTADILDLPSLTRAMAAARPEVVLHLAAQSLVRASYRDPVGTYAANVMGTVHLLEAVRQTPSVRAVIVVTSDKCYKNVETTEPYHEDDRLGGHDPYSSSKACAELVAAAYRESFFQSREPSCAIATVRAGNVIGGGDWAPDRLVPDILVSADRREPLRLRAPASVRPWQHVLEPIAGYLSLAEALCGTDGQSLARGWNFGPDLADCISVRAMVERFATVLDLRWELVEESQLHEAGLLTLDSTRARGELGWKPRLDARQAVLWTAEWHKLHRSGADALTTTRSQIEAYSSLMQGS